MEDFIREQIKEKPLSKKRILIKIGISALCGLIFALVACAVFAVFFMTVGKQNREGDPGTVVDSETETQGTIFDTETETATEVETESETETETEKLPDKDPVPGTEEVMLKEFTIEDYQKIQDQFYAIGTEAGKAIVSVTSVRNNSDWFNNTYDTLGVSAGVIVSIDDTSIYVLVEKKAVTKAKNIFISFDDEEMFEATILGQDSNSGIAVLKLDRKGLPGDIAGSIKAIDISNTTIAKKGLITIAVGHQFGSSNSILAGTITSNENEVAVLDRNYRILTTDIIGSISGSGMLIDTSGNAIGFIRQDLGSSGGSTTVTAIKLSELKPVVDKLLAGEQIPYLGTYVTPVTDAIAKEHGLPSGIYVREVVVDSPAMLAGIQSGDVITKINDKMVTNAYNYYDAILELKPDVPCTVTFLRQGATEYAELECEVTPGVLK